MAAFGQSSPTPKLIADIMQHNVENYTESDLTIALSSPYNSFERQLELEAEWIRREYVKLQQVVEIPVHNQL